MDRHVGLYLNQSEVPFLESITSGKAPELNPVAYRGFVGVIPESERALDYRFLEQALKNDYKNDPETVDQRTLDHLRGFMDKYMASPARSIKYDLWDSVLHNLK